MSKKLVKRSDVPVAETWNLNDLFASEEAYQKRLDALTAQAKAFEATYKGTLSEALSIDAAITELESIMEGLVQTGTYTRLNSDVEKGNEAHQERSGYQSYHEAEIRQAINFFTSELNQADVSLLQETIDRNPKHTYFLKDMIARRDHQLDGPISDALAHFSRALSGPYKTYQMAKLSDIVFNDFEVKGTSYPQSFVLFENEWSFEADTATRRKAYETFYESLSHYQNGFASNYETHLLIEKANATLKGFDTVIDNHLFDQDVSREMYDRQIDIIMSELAPAMRKFAKTLQKIHKLDTMTFADLLLAVDNDYEPNVSIAESQTYLNDGLKLLGDDYLAMINKAFAERWIDFPQNIGKSTGAYCSSPYGNHPFILINWTQRMREVFVLAHELGHAGHFYLANSHQSLLDARPSRYFIEAPSTMNEMIVANHLLENANDDLRLRRWVLSTMISRTYYHNFVTHLLEAAYEREVYTRIEKGQSLSANALNQITLNVMRTFWGDAVEIPDYAGLTWMRQPHYFMSLYPYTYSAGLTISTVASQKLKNEEITVDQWLDVLKAGGTKKPLELASMVGIDLSTDAPLRQTIQTISAMIDEICDITETLGF